MCTASARLAEVRGRSRRSGRTISTSNQNRNHSRRGTIRGISTLPSPPIFLNPLSGLTGGSFLWPKNPLGGGLRGFPEFPTSPLPSRSFNVDMLRVYGVAYALGPGIAAGDPEMLCGLCVHWAVGGSWWRAPWTQESPTAPAPFPPLPIPTGYVRRYIYATVCVGDPRDVRQRMR